MAFDEGGHLAVVSAVATGDDVLTKAALLEQTAWTPPTLAGTNLALRDRRMIVALDFEVAVRHSIP